MPKIKSGKLYQLKKGTKGYYEGQLVEVISISKRYGTCRARMPDGTIQTLLLTLLIEHVAPTLFQIIITKLRNWLTNK